MSTEAVEVTQALVDAINAQSFSLTFTAERNWGFRVNAPDYNDLKVRVVTPLRIWTTQARGKAKQPVMAREITPLVTLGKKHDLSDPATADPLAQLLEELEDFIAGFDLEVAGDKWKWFSQEPAEWSDPTEWTTGYGIWLAQFAPTYQLIK